MPHRYFSGGGMRVRALRRTAQPMTSALARFDVTVRRLGTVLEPDDEPNEAEGVLNPACARAPGGELLLYPRTVAAGNVSRVGLLRDAGAGDDVRFQRLGYALEPSEPYEMRAPGTGGMGCEDPRVTFVPVLDRFLMAYTAFGPVGPRIAVAVSDDAHQWERVGLMNFNVPGLTAGDDKDGAFFPEPVMSPDGVESLAFYHRPMLHLSAVDGRAAIPMIESMPFEDRESIRIGYIPLDRVKRDPMLGLLECAESALVLSPDANWGSLKIGGGTPPVRIAEGWMSIFHGVDVVDHRRRTRPKLRYSAGIVVHDAVEPHRVLYRSPRPLLEPQTESERAGIVDNVVFPTGIDPRPDLGARIFDTYYGMADFRVGAARVTLR